MRAASVEELSAAARDYPALLEDWADAALIARADTALEEGNERLAQAVEERREALAELRARLGAGDAIRAAVGVLLAAGAEEEALAGVLDEHPALLTDAAQDALATLVAEARAAGNIELAERAGARAALLRAVRAGLEER
jgi:hypothetical protein